MGGDGDRETRVNLRVAAAVLLVLVGVGVLAYVVTLGPPDDRAERPTSPEEIDRALSTSPIGGGEAYDDAVSRGDASVVAGNRSALVAALGAADPGEVVFVPGDASIDLTGEAPLVVPRRVTLASDRGARGSDGALLHTDRAADGTPMVVAHEDARVTGLRLRGYGDGWTPASRDRPRGLGVFVPENASGVEIDNNRIAHFVSVCVQSYGDDLSVHNNHVTHCNQLGYGYGVNVGQRALVACNYFDHVRHAVAAPGWPGNAYEARYNVVGRHVQNHPFDMHAPGGESIRVHHNTVVATSTYTSDRATVPSVRVRGVPRSPSAVYANWFFQDAAHAVWQGETRGPPFDDSRYENLEVRDNHFGDSSPPPSVGAFGGLADAADGCT